MHDDEDEHEVDAAEIENIDDEMEEVVLLRDAQLQRVVAEVVVDAHDERERIE